MTLRIELNKGKEIYLCNKVTGYIFRTALKLKERQEKEKLQTELLDEMAHFVCEVFENQFTISQLYQGLEVNKLLSTFNNVLRWVLLSTTLYQKYSIPYKNE